MKGSLFKYCKINFHNSQMLGCFIVAIESAGIIYSMMIYINQLKYCGFESPFLNIFSPNTFYLNSLLWLCLRPYSPLWHIVYLKKDHSIISSPTCSSRAFQTLLISFPLELQKIPWLPWWIGCDRSNNIWLPRLGHKRLYGLHLLSQDVHS